ncbi:hypothetical protein MVEN_01118300 [Mycena venus]|uniref:Uncharacterized protein n=1 Tax=Mycena venus TaxID=2733690 RepID=A0A8H6Y502_9AGAR|nr:hypothetical protein MVEN_01118300 [Mycena venus]
MVHSPGFLYRLACTLSLAHIASGLATIFVYDVDDARDSQFIAILYALSTFYMVYMLIPHATERDNDPLSRLNKQFVIINFLLLSWLLSVGLIPLTVDVGIMRTVSHCAEKHFMSPKCLTLGLDMTLPLALIATLATISWNISRSARAIQASTPPRSSHPLTPFKLRPSARALRANSNSNSNSNSSVAADSV